MARARRRGIQVALALLLAVVAVATAVAIDRRISEARYRDAADQLLLVMTLRRDALEAYLDTVRAELTFWSRSPALREEMRQLREAWAAIPGDPTRRLQDDYIRKNPFPPEARWELDGVDDGSAYAAAHRAIHGLAREFVSERGYYDLFLIDPEGNVVYTVDKEDDFARSLRGPALAATGLAEVFRRAASSGAEAGPGAGIAFSDLARYGPSGDAPALFGAAPIVDEAGRLLGVFALQVPIERIQETMQFSEGMGRTGETYLVGRDHVMRSDSRFGAEPTTLDTRVETEAVRRALEGESGVALTSDFRGVEVLSAYAPFAMDGIDWAVIAEIDEEEVYEAVVDLRLSVPLLGFALYALAVLTLWILDPSGWVARDLEDLDVGEMPAP